MGADGSTAGRPRYHPWALVCGKSAPLRRSVLRLTSVSLFSLESLVFALRLAVHTDDLYRCDGESISSDLAFALFLGGLTEFVDRLVLVGRLHPEPGRAPHRLPAGADFVALPYFSDLTRPLAMARVLPGALRKFWRLLDEIDAVWLLGPSPLGFAFAGLARLRGRSASLGVRMNYPAYVRYRHPGRRLLHAFARVLDLGWRLLGRRLPTVVVGRELAARYGRSPRLLTASISLVRETDLVNAAAPTVRTYDGDLVVLSVGRLDAEKNPLLLADVLRRLCEQSDRWRLVVCGDGPLRGELTERLRALAIADRAELRGYVELDRLRELYRESHALLHVSRTEGVPQVLFEAFAAGLPVVATDVGGVAEAAGEAALLVPPGDAAAAVAALERLAERSQLREQLVRAGLAEARTHTLQAECRRLAHFLRDGRPVGPMPARTAASA
jgi:glycosyltransferase involved in cell wall biosynthesis